MSSKRHVRKRSCTGKIRYSKAEAEEVAARIMRQKREWLRAYHCSFCRAYHVGHAAKGERV